MSDREESQPEEEVKSSEMSEEDLEHVAAAGDVNLTFVNQSNDKDNSGIVVFKKPSAT